MGGKILIRFLFLSISLLLTFGLSEGVSKYSAAVNTPAKDIPAVLPSSVRELSKPFRMAKLNLLWSKAKHVSLCSEIFSLPVTRMIADHRSNRLY